LIAKLSFYNKSTIQSNVISLALEPILYKNGGIGASVGHGVAKMEASPPNDASMLVEDEVPAHML
jgi:hypothetical protein